MPAIDGLPIPSGFPPAITKWLANVLTAQRSPTVAKDGTND
jgi:hypothetical protein